MFCPFVSTAYFPFPFTGVPSVIKHAERGDTRSDYGGDRLVPTTHATQGAAAVISWIAIDLSLLTWHKDHKKGSVLVQTTPLMGCCILALL